MRLLTRNARVTTRFGGKFVHSINRVAGGQQAGDPSDWFFYVNGVESGKGATEVRVHDGERIWWDVHDWGGVMDTPAVVGAFPEPFAHGIDGKKLPTRVECAPPGTPACQTAVDNLVNAGIIAAEGGFEASNVQDTLRVLVGDWGSLRHDIAAGLLEKPAAGERRVRAHGAPMGVRSRSTTPTATSRGRPGRARGSSPRCATNTASPCGS